MASNYIFEQRPDGDMAAAVMATDLLEQGPHGDMATAAVMATDLLDQGPCGDMATAAVNNDLHNGQSGASNIVSEIIQDSQCTGASGCASNHQAIECKDMYQVNGNNTKTRDYFQISGSGPVTIYNGTAPMSPNGTEEDNIQAERDESNECLFSENTADGIPPMNYNELRFDVCCDLTDRQFKLMRLLLEKGDNNFGIPRKDLRGLKSTLELLDCIEHYNYLSSANTWLLQYMLYRVGNIELYKRVFEFLTEQLTSSTKLFVCEPREIQGMLNST
ncbi:uncharacterized protein [Amphiura filiformis]|uniref:uncharacterized protein n=1 Tax=Amphiura filiformis TaxID=82378 RepID=UPI003B21ACB8